MDQAWITHTLSARRQNRQYSATFQQRQGHAVTSVATIQHEAQAAPIIDNDQRHDHHPLVQSQEYGFIEPCHEGAGELVDLNNANRAPKQLDSQIELHDNWTPRQLEIWQSKAGPANVYWKNPCQSQADVLNQFQRSPEWIST